MINHWSRAGAMVLLLAAVSPAFPSPVAAQGTGDGFLFKQPTLQLGLHGGYALAQTNSGVFNRAMDDFTLGKRDFDASSWGLGLAIRTSERFDVALDLRFSRSETPSESRPYLGDDGLPITQTTTFTRVPLTVSGKYYLRDRGRSVSQFAWIPEKWAPFVGAGAGWHWFKFRQEGEFVEEPSLDIIPLILESSGFGAVAHVFAGVDISMNSRFLWTVEGRYTLGRGKTGVAFDYAKVDLSGLQATVGISARF